MRTFAGPIVLLLAVLASIALRGNVIAVPPLTKQHNPKNEFPADLVGTVTKHGVDTCMVGANYDLHSKDKTTTWLVAISKTDRATLDKASQTGDSVHVKGEMMIDVSHCQWVRVNSVTVIKKK